MRERVKILKHDNDQLLLHVFPTRNAGNFSYPFVLLLIWIMGSYLLGIEFINTDHAGMLTFLSIAALLWLACGVFIIYVFFWRLFGREVLLARNNTIETGKLLPGMRITKTIPIDKIQQLSRAGLNEKAMRQSMSANYFGIMGGSVLIHTVDGVHRFGMQLPVNETDKIVVTVTDWLKAKQS